MGREGDEPTADATGKRAAGGRKKSLVRVSSWVLWLVVLAFQGWLTSERPSAVNAAMLAGFGLLFVAVNAQILLVRWMGRKRWTRAMNKLSGAAYLSELENLPNRNYLLSELRREMPRARTVNVPFCLVIVSLDTIDEVRARRGEEFSTRAVRALADVLKRFTRTSDFIAHLGGARFCVMLTECRYEDSFIYLQRVPGSVAVSDGHRMYEVPVAARIHQYDLESLYATDVLGEAEEAKPLKRQETRRFGTEAA